VRDSVDEFFPEEMDLLEVLRTRVPFGKYAGSRLIEVPLPHLAWLADTCKATSPRLRAAIRALLAADEQHGCGFGSGCSPLVNWPIALRVWYREQRRLYDPTHGGSPEVANALPAICRSLVQIMRGTKT
jgi:hypothetical protein